MFEGKTRYIAQIVFRPAPYFLLALGAGLFPGLVMLAEVK
jgi:hypothetical protein